LIKRAYCHELSPISIHSPTQLTAIPLLDVIG
jgi:hypothetical protein